MFGNDSKIKSGFVFKNYYMLVEKLGFYKQKVHNIKIKLLERV